MFDRLLAKLHLPSFAAGVAVTVAGISIIQITVAIIEGSGK